MSNEVDDPSLRQEAWELCKEYLLGPWSEVSLDDFRLFNVKGGFSNSLYRCALPENADVDATSTPKNVLLRLYGAHRQDASSIMKDVVTFLLLSVKKLGPKLYGVFPTGRLEEFIPSHTLCTAELRKYAPFIARELAKVHATDFPLSKLPDLWSRTVNSWLMDGKEFFDKYGKFVLTFSEYKKEIEWVSEEIKKTNCPIVFCHNDLAGGNILYREDKPGNEEPKIILIDFEFGYYTHRSLDIADHLVEWCFEYGDEIFTIDFEKFPSKEEQFEFCAAYLDQLTKEGVKLKKPLNEELKTMVEEINIFACATNLRWALYCIKRALSSSDIFENFNPTVLEMIRKKEKETFKEKTVRRTESVSSEDGRQERLESIMVEMCKEFCEKRMNLYETFKKRYLEANIAK